MFKVNRLTSEQQSVDNCFNLICWLKINYDRLQAMYKMTLFYQNKVTIHAVRYRSVISLRRAHNTFVHYYQKRVQSKEYTRQVHELSEGEMVVHVDYSENYKNKQKNEIKAAYYGQGTFSLYMVVLYTKDGRVVKSRSFALVTVENNHSFNISYGLN